MTIHAQIKIHRETIGDLNSIREINLQAFAGPSEAALVELLRKNNKATISLVAFQDEQTVGHILFSPVTFDPPHPNLKCLGLAPMAVLPKYQNRGIGSSLVRSGLRACKQQNIDAVIVLGHVEFYPRFEFRPARKFDLDSEYDVGDALMALELKPGKLKEAKGRVLFAPEFNQVGN